MPLIFSIAKDFKNGVAEVILDGKWIKIDKKAKVFDLKASKAHK
jgi:hypothetical protein